MDSNIELEVCKTSDLGNIGAGERRLTHVTCRNQITILRNPATDVLEFSCPVCGHLIHTSEEDDLMRAIDIMTIDVGGEELIAQVLIDDRKTIVTLIPTEMTQMSF
jgi:hypothetical protein